MNRYPIRKASREDVRDYQHWIASLGFPKKQKAPSENERYIKLLNKAVCHPEKMLMNLPKVGEGKIQLHGTFFKRSNCLKEGFYYFGGNVQSSVTESRVYGFRGVKPTSPASPVSPKPGQNRRINDKSELSESILAAQKAIEHFEEVANYLIMFNERLERRGNYLNFDNPKSGLPQLAGFCERINMVTEPTIVGVDNLSHTSYFGLKIASEFLQDPNSHLNLRHEKIMPILYKGPTHEHNLEARIKLQVGRDAAIGSYERLGRQGFRGGWASLKNHNEKILSPEEVEIVVLELLKGTFALEKWSNSAIDLFRTLVHTDTAEKRYLLAHLKSMRIQDQIDVVLRVDESRDLAEKLYQAVTEVHQRSLSLCAHLKFFEIECRNQREAADTVNRASSESFKPTEKNMNYKGDKKEILSKEDLKFIQEFVNDKMENMENHYYYEPISFPLDEPFRSS